MKKANKKKVSEQRAQPKEVRREQLIRATMHSIAQNGLSGTTMATVTKKAGLSLGIANLHFKSKENMLIETLRYVTEEYTRGHAEIMSSDRYDTTAKKIQAMRDFDFSKKLIQKNKLAVWVAFWGEAKSRPIYQRIHSESDIQSENSFRDIFQTAIDEAGYTHTSAEIIARGYTALVDGLWLDLLVAPKQFNREQALQVATHYLASAFPQHISTDS